MSFPALGSVVRPVSPACRFGGPVRLNRLEPPVDSKNHLSQRDENAVRPGKSVGTFFGGGGTRKSPLKAAKKSNSIFPSQKDPHQSGRDSSDPTVFQPGAVRGRRTAFPIPKPFCRPFAKGILDYQEAPGRSFALQRYFSRRPSDTARFPVGAFALCFYQKAEYHLHMGFHRL